MAMHEQRGTRLAEWWRAFVTRLEPRESTRRLWREARAAGQPWWRFAHTWFYARWPYGYIGAAIGERAHKRLWLPFFAPFLATALNPHRWAASYHGKVVPTGVASRLVEVNEPIAEVVPEQVIPYESARDLILAAPTTIVALDCPCRLARENPCLPLDVCLVVGEPFTSFVLDHHPDRARAITPAEAVVILQAEAGRGHVHHAFFKEAMLDRFYAICNCCSCCCGAISAQRNGTPMVISSGYVAAVDDQACVRCGACAAVCPFDAITGGECVAIDADACMGCGVCVKQCPHGALSLQRDQTKPEPLVV